MKRILYIANFTPGLGGISGQVEYLVRNLSCDEAYYTEIFTTKRSFLKRILCFFSLLNRSRSFDILHVHGCSFRGFLPIVYGVIVGKIWKKRIIITYHGGDADQFFAKRSKWVRFWLMKADERVVLSGFLKAVFDKYSIPARIIPNIVELSDDVYVEKTKLLPRFISVRHLSDLYNIPCVLRAFRRVQSQVPEATLTLLGDGEKRVELERFVADKKLNHVRFVGQVPNGEVGSFLRENDILLSAPRIDNMPVSLLEAFSAGLLVISSNVGGVPYMIEHGLTGLLFKSDNDEEMAEQMLWALANQDESLRIIRNAKEDVLKYSWEKVGKQIRALYE